MTSERTPDPIEDRDYKTIAAEYSLGLLEGEELLAARGRMIEDPVFAARREWWDDWFVPMTDDMPGAQPDARLWATISERVQALETRQKAAAADPVGEARSNVTAINSDDRVRRWKWVAGLTSVAAALAIALLFIPGVNDGDTSSPRLADAGEAPAEAGSPLMASIPIGDTPLRLGVTVLPSSEEMLVSASGLIADGVHDHELWLVPGDGSELRSLGVIEADAENRVSLTPETAALVENGSQLLLTREPLGGKPEGREAGPVVAEGVLEAV